MALQPAIRLGGSFQSPGVLEQQQAHNEKQGEQDDQGREWRHQQKRTGQRFRNQIGPVSHVAHGPAHSRIRDLFQERSNQFIVNFRHQMFQKISISSI